MKSRSREIDIVLRSLWNLTGKSTAQHQIGLSNFRAIGSSLISISQFRYFKTLGANCLQTATAPQGGAEKWLLNPFLRTRSGHPPASRNRPAVVETHNMKILWPKNPLGTAVTAPRKWKRTLMRVPLFIGLRRNGQLRYMDHCCLI